MNARIFTVTNANFREEVLQSQLPTLVDFTLDYCPPCKMIAPIIAEIAGKYEGQMRVGSLDGNDYPELAEQFDVYGFPTLILFRDGVPVERIVGYTPRQKIEAKVAPYLPQPVDAR